MRFRLALGLYFGLIGAASAQFISSPPTTGGGPGIFSTVAIGGCTLSVTVFCYTGGGAGDTLAIGGATIGSNALSVMGTFAFSAGGSFGGALTGITSLAASTNITGLNASGSNATATGLTVINALSTGTATNPDLVFQTGVKTTSGSSQATPTTALKIKGETQVVNVASAGSAAAPSLAVGNSTTGLYSVSTTGLGLAVNGVDLLDYGISHASAWTMGQTLLMGTDNSYNIGANGANRPANLFLANSLYTTYMQYSTTGGYINMTQGNAATTLVERGVSSNAGFIVQGASGQTGDLQQWNVNGGSPVAQISSAGVYYSNGSAGVTKSCATTAATLTITGGIITATSGC